MENYSHTFRTVQAIYTWGLGARACPSMSTSGDANAIHGAARPDCDCTNSSHAHLRKRLRQKSVPSVPRVAFSERTRYASDSPFRRAPTHALARNAIAISVAILFAVSPTLNFATESPNYSKSDNLTKGDDSSNPAASSSTVGGATTGPARLPAQPHPASGTPSQHCYLQNCNAVCVSIPQTSVTSISASSAKVAWSDITLKDASATDSFDYGTNPDNLNLGATPSHHAVTLTGLTLNTIYYYVAQAELKCGASSYFAFANGCLFTISSGVYACASNGALSLSSVSATKYGSTGTVEQISWILSPAALEPPGNSPIVNLQVGSVIYHGVSSPYLASGLSIQTTYMFELTASAPAYNSTSYSGVFNTNCVVTEISGYVYLRNSGTGIYEADVWDNDVFVAQTDTNGHYLVGFGCSPVSYRITAEAIGYNNSGATLASGNANANVNTIIDISGLQPYPTDTEGFTRFYNSDNHTLAFSSYGTAQNVAGAGVTSITPPVEVGPPPSGNSQILQFTGDDTSSSTSPTASAAFSLGTVVDPDGSSGGIPLSAPVSLQFNVFIPVAGDPSYPTISGNFTVDAVLNDGSTLDSENGIAGGPPMSSFGSNCAPQDMNYTPGQWQIIDCDLTFLRNVNVTEFLLVYFNGGSGVPGIINAFFDDISLVEPFVPKQVRNGGFEVGTVTNGLNIQPVGWSFQICSQETLVTSTTGKVATGVQALRLGSSSPEQSCWDSIAWERLRVPNNIGSTTLSLSLEYWSTIGTGGQVAAFILDEATDQTEYIIPTSAETTSTTKWTPATLPLSSPSVAGDIIDIYLQVEGSSTSGSYSYFDDVYLVESGESLSEKGSGTYPDATNTALIGLADSTYAPFLASGHTCGSLTYNSPISGVGQSASDSQWYSEGGDEAWVGANVTLGTDLWSYGPDCASGYNVAQIGVDVTANATGVPSSQTGGFLGIESICLTEAWSAAPASDVVPVPSSWGPYFESQNLGGSGSPGIMNNILYDALGIAIEVGAEGLSEYVTDGALFVADAFAPIDILTAFEIGLLLFGLLVHGGGSGPTCNAPTNGIARGINGAFDSQGYPPKFVAMLSEFDADLGCTSSFCTGGVYTMEFSLTVYYCELLYRGTCNSPPFDSITSNVDLTFTTTG